MDLRPGVNYFDGVNNFEMFGITNNTVMPVMIAVSPQMAQSIVPPTSGPSKLPTLHENPIHSQYIPSGLILPPNVKPEHIQQLEYPATGSVGGSSSSNMFYPMGITNNLCPRHKQQQHFPTNITSKNVEKTKRKWNMETIEEACADSASIDNSSSSTCIPNFILGNLGGGTTDDNYGGGGKSNAEDCTVGCNALMIMGIVGGGGGNNSSGNNSSINPLRFGFTNRSCIDANESVNDLDYVANQPCNCPHVNFDRMSPEVQTTGFGGLPDVTEHSNIRRTTLSRQNSLSMSSELTDISTLQKSKKSIKSSNRNSSSSTVSCRSINQKPNRRFCIFSFTLLAAAILIIVASMAIYHFVFLTPSRNSHEERLKIVRKILKEVPLVDGHNDFPYNVRTYAHGSLELLELNHNVDHKNIWDRPKWSQTDIKRLKEGLVGAQIWSAYVPCEAQGLDAVQLALEQIDIIHRYADLNSKDTMLATTSKDILLAHKSGLLASLVGVVGGHSLGSSLGVLRSFHALGARYLTLTHECDVSWAGSSATANEKGLTVFGKAVIKEMNRLGMLIDLSYSSDSTAKDVLEFTRAPIIYSHSAARSLCNSSRNIPDDIIRSVTDNGGLIMISFDSEYVSCSEHDSNMHDVIAHIKYIRSITGVQHIGIGAGFDGIKKTPSGLEDVSKYPNLLAALLKDPNWSEEDIAMLSGKNFLRVLQSVENVRDYYKKMSLEPLENSEPIKKTQCSYMSS